MTYLITKLENVLHNIVKIHIVLILIYNKMKFKYYISYIV